MNRRGFLAMGVAAALAATVRAQGSTTIAGRDGARAALGRLERTAGGRLGVHLIDPASGRDLGYRSDERFLLLSTFKVLAAALVLHRVDAGKESLERPVPFSRDDLLEWSPVTGQHADGRGMAVGELCAAAVGASDNTAGNLLLASVGGPPALTAYVRGLGDSITRLDRTEPALNTGRAADGFDVTSPRAMAQTLYRLACGDALRPDSRGMLQGWLRASTTGARRIRAGLPAGWRCGDKTGTNTTGAADVAVAWPPRRPPFVVTAYLAETRATVEVRDATIAAAARVLVPGD